MAKVLGFLCNFGGLLPYVSNTELNYLLGCLKNMAQRTVEKVRQTKKFLGIWSCQKSKRPKLVIRMMWEFENRSEKAYECKKTTAIMWDCLGGLQQFFLRLKSTLTRLKFSMKFLHQYNNIFSGKNEKQKWSVHQQRRRITDLGKRECRITNQRSFGFCQDDDRFAFSNDAHLDISYRFFEFALVVPFESFFPCILLSKFVTHSIGSTEYCSVLP